MENPVPLKPMRTNYSTAGSLGAFPRRPRCWQLAVAIIILIGMADSRAADPGTNQTARVTISGYGFFGNLEMLRLLENFQPDKKLPSVITRNFVEDASLVLFAQANSEGYLNARLKVTFQLPDGSSQTAVWTNALDVRLPREFEANAADFRLQKGVRFYYESIQFKGLNAISERDARNFFVSGDTLVRLHANRIFSPDLLRSSIANLSEALRRKGYRSAVVKTNSVRMDEGTGAVTVQIGVEQGLPSMVRSVVVNVADGGGNPATNHWTVHPNQPYSSLWQQNFSRQLREDQYGQGYPDATVKLNVSQTQTNANEILMDLTARLTNGPLVYVAGVAYQGNKLTRTSVLENVVKLREGELLDRNAAEESRQRLARLGVFQSVNVDYEELDPTNWNVTYKLKESQPVSLSLLAGYGSYELLRGGVEYEDRNVLGLAQDLRLRAVQSFKSSSLDGVYTVPEIFGADMNGFVSGSGLRREEVTFTREEAGGSFGIQKFLDPIETDFSAHYDYQFLNAYGLGTANRNDVGVTYARSAAFIFDFNRDQRHTPILPVTGTKLFARLEFAAAGLGGNVTYQRFIFGGSYNLDLHGGLLLHLGVLQGDTLTMGGNSQQLPFTKRFFPGGANSVRGYQDGEASPLDATGQQLGAETYTQGNIEFEQLVTESWSVVAFLDAVGFAEDRTDYPFDEGLYSVGGGVRWRSIIGPIRLEYGYNLHRRAYDPVGTLHFSVGFPF
jgi:outer membrane protein insertion porin family